MEGGGFRGLWRLGGGRERERERERKRGRKTHVAATPRSYDFYEEVFDQCSKFGRV